MAMGQVERHVVHVRDRDCSIFVLVFKNVTNVKNIRPMLMDGTINAALVSAKKIVSSFQLVVAANIALHNQEDGSMKTKNINSEIIFSLSPGKQISEAFRQFGASADDTAVAAVAVDDEERLRPLLERIDGTAVPASELAELADRAAIGALYQVAERELSVGSLEEAVVNRIATRCVT